MASEVDVANRALQKLGQDHITALTDETVNARRINACFAELRDAELTKHPWVFAIKREALAEDSTAPNWGKSAAFTLPADYLAIHDDYEEDNRDKDWQIEGRKIYTNESAPLYLRYIYRVTDPNEMNALFREAWACRIAIECCEQITQSTSMKEALKDDYERVVREARKLNAIARRPIETFTSSWETVRY